MLEAREEWAQARPEAPECEEALSGNSSHCPTLQDVIQSRLPESSQRLESSSVTNSTGFAGTSNGVLGEDTVRLKHQLSLTYEEVSNMRARQVWRRNC